MTVYLKYNRHMSRAFFYVGDPPKDTVLWHYFDVLDHDWFTVEMKA